MKKILIDKTLYGNLNKYETVLQRADVKVFMAATSDEVLALHRQEKMNLIIARLDAPGTPPERVYSEIRNDAELRTVSLILVCEDRAGDKMRAERCGANAIMTQPIENGNVLEKANSFLNVPTRGSYRVLLSVSIDATREKSFFCRSENISATGLLLETDRTLAPGDVLHCSFFLPGAKQIEATGEIARVLSGSDKPGMKHYGVKFTRITPLDSAAIREFIRKKVGRG